MFRSPEEVTPSDPESSSEDEGLEEVPTVTDGQPLATGDAGATEPDTSSDIERNKQVNLFYSSLLEDFCINRAIRNLNSQGPSGQTLDENDPKVQALARANYSLLSQQLGPLGVVGQGYELDQWRDHRQTYREALEVMLDHALKEGVVLGTRRPTSTSLSPLATPFISSVPRPITSRPVSPRLLTGASIDTTSIPSIEERLGKLQLHDKTYAISGSPPTAMLSAASGLEHPIFQPSRYRTDFAELRYIGKGGYGKVFQVLNHLDGQQYAIKKITLSSKRLRKLRNDMGKELEELLREIRALARLEHLNVVRYFGGWIEQSNVLVTRDPPLLTGPAGAVSSDGVAGNEDSFSLGLQFEDDRDGSVAEADDGGILFGYSSNSVEESNNSKRGRERRAGQRTTSSSVAMKSFVQSTGANDDDVESIPRPLGIPTRGQPSTDTNSTQTPSPDGGNAHPSHRRRESAESSEPTWTLYIQMSLYPVNLTMYLSQTSQASAQGTTLGSRHCFHLLPSLRIILAILSGVEYLHTQDLIHRDLKPANIFLSIHKGTAHSPGCIDIAPCSQCEGTNKEPTYIIPRIGDFGLVADISSKAEDPSRSNGSSLVTIHGIAEPLASSYKSATVQHPLTELGYKAIGTEFYRPPTRAAFIDEKLDVFSLGVIAFELLWKFETSKSTMAIYACMNITILNSRRNGTPHGFDRSEQGRVTPQLLETGWGEVRETRGLSSGDAMCGRAEAAEL